MAKADGSVIIETQMDTRGFQTGVADMQKGFGGLSSSIGKIGKLIAGVFIAKKLIDFGREAIQLGSDLEEVQNVVDVTFTTMSEKVNEFAKNAAATAGLSETMAKRYVGTFGAMSKSFGFTEDRAYEMSTALTQLAGDVASFYNITQDEAYKKLKSVFTGETETLKDLGVVMTQTALDDYALRKGFGKTTKQMSEQEKVALRYSFVLDQLSGASGDFVRTSDSWANQTRILKLQFDSLKATIGQGLINVLTPVLKVINTLLGKLQTLANAFKSFTELITGKKADSTKMAEGLSESAAAAEEATEANEGYAKSVKSVNKELGEYDKLSVISQDSGDNGGGSAGAASVDFGSLEQGENIMDSMSQSMNNMLSIFGPLKSAWEEYGGSIRESLGKIVTDVKNFGKRIINATIEWFKNLNWDPLFSAFNNLLSGLEPLIDGIGNFLSNVYENIILPIAKYIIEHALPFIIDLFASLFHFLGENEWIIELIGSALLGFFSAKKIMPMISFVKKIITSIKGLITILGQGGLLNIIQTVIGTLGGPLTIIIGAVIALLILLITHWDEVKSTMKKFDQWLQGVFEKDWSKSFGVFGEILNGFLQIVEGIWTTIKGVLTGIINLIKGVFTGEWEKAWEAIVQIFSSIWNGIVGIIKGVVNTAIGIINALINGIVSGINTVINALNSLDIDIPDWVPVFGGNKFGLNIPQLTAPKIPYLAKGAVVPPNAPFMAVLGDNKKETEVVSPMSTMEEAFERVISKYAGTMGSQAPIQLILNGRVVAEAVWDEERKRYKQTGRPVTS